MPISTRAIYRVVYLLVLLCASLEALAQTAPPWQSARTLGRISTYSGAIAVDAAGNTYEVRSFVDSTTIGGVTLTSQGYFDGYLAKYMPSGTLAWVRQIGSADDDFANDVTLDVAGSVYITGSFTGSIALSNTMMLDGGNGAGYKAFVARYSPLGTPEWVQQSNAADDQLNEGNSIATDGAGNVYVTGSLDDSISIGSVTATLPGSSSRGVTGGYLARFSGSTGALQLLVPAFHYASPINFLAYRAPKLAVRATGEVFLLAQFFHSIVFANATLTTRGQSDVAVARFGALGTFQWAQQFGGTEADELGEGVVDEAGNLYVAASFTGPATFGTTTLAGAGDSDGCLVKYSPTGTMQWVQTSGGPGSDSLDGVSLDAAGNPCVLGSFNSIAQIGTTTLTSAGSSDILVASYSPQGQVRWVQHAGGPAYSIGFDIDLDASGDVYILGSFTGTCAFGPLTITTTAPYEAFIARLGNRALSAQAARSTTLALYPNPASNYVYLEGLPTGSRVQLLDAVGRVVRTTAASPAATVSVRGLAGGLYVVRATDAQGRQYAGRVVVE